ncbi:MAG TPA: SIR2 family protein [Bacteroidia bacterium]|nr:SIR2 family protein [Bacteroidia bacterium]
MKKLLIVVGAGASLDFGMPSVKTIDGLLENWSKEILPLKEDNNKGLYTWVREKLAEYISQNPKNRVESIINFENLLYTIQNLSALSRNDQWQQFNNRLRPFIELNAFPEVDSVLGSDFNFLHSYLIDNLLKYFRNKCNTLDVDKSNELQLLRNFFLSLKEDFQLGFINLNYDNVVLSALPDLKTGFDTKTGEFKRELLYNSEWGFCYHMHGSVHFDMKGGDGTEMHKIFWNNDLSSTFSQNSSGRSSNYTSEGIDHLNSCIIAGLDKTNQLLKEPFGQYYMQLDRLAYESDAILIMGYGFSDIHLNRIFPFTRYDKTKTRKVVIIDWASEGEDGFTYRNDSWTTGVFATFPYNGHEMGEDKTRIPRPVSYYKSKKILEKSSNPVFPLAIWYDGIIDACKHGDKIIKEL